jgi:LysM repeat protein
MSFLDNMREWFENVFNRDDCVEVTVAKGDTLWGICQRASGSTSNAAVQRHVEEVMQMNPGMDPDMIRPGDKLKLPLKWAAEEPDGA